MDRHSNDRLATHVRPERVPQAGDDNRGGAPRLPGPNPSPGSVPAWTRGRLAAAPRTLWEGLLIVAAVVVVWYLQQWIGAFLLLVALIGFGAWRVADALFRPSTVADRILLAITTTSAWIVLVAELLSAGRLLGQPGGWLVGGAALALAGLWLPARSLSSPRPHKGVTRVSGVGASSWIPAHPVGRLLLLVIGLHLGAVFFLTWFTGINVGDSVAAYLPRSVRYLQNGTFAIYDTNYDFMPAFHQTLVAIQLLFLRSDILVVPMSFLSAVAASLGIFAFSRSLGWSGHLPLAAALLPWMMPAFLLHASTSNFDILTGLWLLLSLYFLRRGYAASSPRWLAAAALATGLALATKPTFWFAAPALGLCWLVTLLRALRRRRLAHTARLALTAAVLVAVLGTPYLVRNALIQGTLFGPPGMRTYTTGDLSLPDRFYLMAFNSLALGFQLVTPPSLMAPERALELNDRFAERAQALGFSLPDERLTPHQGWSELIRHAAPGHRYDGNHAGLGAAFVLIVIPSMLAVVLRRRRLGPYWRFAIGVALFGIGYVLVHGFVQRYQSSTSRYMIEPAIALAVIAPAWVAMLPRTLHGPILVALALVLIPEMNDVIRNSRWTPPDRVMQTARLDQVYVFAGAPPADAARMLERKYPPSELPELFIHDEGGGHANFPDYTFQGPTLQRRTRYWVPGSSALPPGPFLTFDSTLAGRLVADGMVPDRLSASAWLLLPNDRLRVRMTIVQEGAAADQILRLEASAAPGSYRNPSFGFFLLDGGNTIRLQRFGPETTLSIPLNEARKGALRIEVRDGDQGRTAERVTISKAVIGGL